MGFNSAFKGLRGRGLWYYQLHSKIGICNESVYVTKFVKINCSVKVTLVVSRSVQRRIKMLFTEVEMNN